MVKENIGHKSRRYFKDIFTTCIDAKWRWTLTIFISNFLGLWTLFACCWFSMAYARGDIEYYVKWLEAIDKTAFEMEFPRTPCVRHLYSFSSAFLFSIETQHTIGIYDEVLQIVPFLSRIDVCRLWFSTCDWRMCWWSFFDCCAKVINFYYNKYSILIFNFIALLEYWKNV